MKLINWIGAALSDGGEPSSKRLIAFMFAVVVCFGVCWDVVSKLQNQFAQYLFAGLLIAIFLLLGVATVPQIIELWKGKKGDVKDKAEGQ